MNTLNTSDWWQGCVIYQIYPRSYQDTNGDGIGDLRGITQRLPYIRDLGVDAIWISPFFKSPMDDFGYDVSDYCDIDPMFGNMADFDALLAKAHELGLKVMIDLVLSHSSEQHPWFVESRTSRDNKKADWYVWSDAQADGTPPNNWLSIFGGSAWQWDARREQYYLHNFLASQPDLNFHCDEVQNELLDVTRYWLQKGVDGFRLDTINFYVHDKQLRSNPPLSPKERNSSIAPAVNPYNYQNHLYSKNQPENMDFLRRLRSLLDEYEGRTLLGEIGDAQYGLEILGQYTSGNERAHMCYAFEFLESRPMTPDWVQRTLTRLAEVAADGWACWAFSNHDVMRHKTRWNLSDAGAKTYAALMMCLRGSACIYQGEELGFGEAEVTFDALQDPYGKEFWPKFKGRDGCRTPMVWEANQVQGGFTSGKPWLPISRSHMARVPAMQKGVVGSMLTHYQQVIAMRHTYQALAKGSLINMQATKQVLSFERQLDDEILYCCFNLSPEVASVAMPGGDWHRIDERLPGLVEPSEQLTLAAWQYVIAVKNL
ncbi:MAG: alpha-glucosidase [Gammaproteobacteria bacterium]|nr:alpha-glucosidase [Gammaproteobacteria bacterium]MCP4880907.1 alpha-glucosidase [Gammaproteobacteria bacterium]